MRKTLSAPPAGRNGNSEGEPSLEGLWVKFFGDFEVFYRCEAVDLGRNSRAAAIFRRLLAEHPRPLSQEIVMDWLWPESRPRQARWSLNSAIYALRRVLGNLAEELSDCVVLDGDRYRISSSLPVSSDVQEFEVHYERGRLLERCGEIEEAILEYEEAVGFYRNDYLLGDLYADWTMIERERLLDEYVILLDRLSDYYLDDGQLHKSIGLCYQILEKDHYNEESYRRLMRCYARLGLRSRSAKQYELCRQMLGRFYDAAPAEETQTLHRRLLRGEDI